ncbi:MAG: aminobenzoate synthetase [Sphingomonas bacterium]|uniref:aminodeoxychorismate synthase component I n=1 Tax=Sphingomonas bacterium TaxID=1895847 RepID=UPI0026317EB8|nr:aminodeoxychorismate synthase component I [Sphingomonas bacterium]MDB5709367.1 aminobenzoate synthetase [Sphingomonas bacterium]
MLADETKPFVLLDDARPGGAAARLYRAPLRTIVAATPAQVPGALAALRAARAEGLHAAGYLSYEAGAALQPRTPVLAGDGPVLWFGLFEQFEEIAHDEVPALLPDPAGAWAGVPCPTIDRETYDARLARVQALISAGDIYQANLTYQTTVAMLGDPLALYARLRAASHAGHGAIVATGARTYLSLSPELFFALDGDRLTCRPMKGTAPRGATPEEDRALAEELATDDKQRAENLMIVDLMRNDLSRVAVAGSVAVPALFAVETYPTVLQMTSTVTATLAADRDAVDVIEALFPCGSITGAPKSRAMAVIAEVEGAPRGLYTGSIGRIDANGDAMFNVAIRTLAIEDGAATLGLGSGIVADSRAAEEWAECAAKGLFVTAGQRRFDLIETMAFDPESGMPRLERHLARMKASAELLGFSFDRHGARNELQAATFRLRTARRIRLVLAASGALAIEVAPLPEARTGPMTVSIVRRPAAASDFRLQHKTSDRAFYDAARRTAGADEVIFEDNQGYLTEGSFTSLFVQRDGVLVTPPLSRGLLPGVLRAELIDTGQALEGELTAADLADGFLVGNALRGLMPAIVAPVLVATAKKSEL